MSFRLTYSYDQGIEASVTRFDEPDEDDEQDTVGVTVHLKRHHLSVTSDDPHSPNSSNSPAAVSVDHEESAAGIGLVAHTGHDQLQYEDPSIIEKATRFENLPQNLKERVINGLQEATELIEKHQRDQSHGARSTCTSSCCSCVKSCFIPSSSAFTKDIVPPHLSLPYELGLNMSRDMFLPAMPFFFRDIWILVEVVVTVAQLVLAALSIPNAINFAVTIVFVTLTALNTLLAIIDALIYYYELGSYKYLLKSCLKTMRKSQRTKKEEEEREGTVRYCHRIRLSEKRKKSLNQWFEVVRTVLSELLLYPLIVFDLYDVGRNGFINQRLDFSIFLISSIYLILSVYIARSVMIVFIFKNILKLLKGTEFDSSSTGYIVRFFAHTLVQIVAHLSCIAAVGLKIHNENGNNEGYSASPFLWVAMFGGWIIPFAGVAMFFLANYFWTQQYSIGLCIEMMSLIQVPNIAQSLFKSLTDIEEDALAKSQAILDKMKFTKVKEDYKLKLEKAKTITKLVYPGKIIPFLVLTFGYVIILIVFFVSLVLEVDNSGQVRFIVIDNVFNLFIVGCIVIIAIANVQILLVSPWLPHVALFTIFRRIWKSSTDSS